MAEMSSSSSTWLTLYDNVIIVIELRPKVGLGSMQIKVILFLCGVIFFSFFPFGNLSALVIWQLSTGFSSLLWAFLSFFVLLRSSHFVSSHPPYSRGSSFTLFLLVRSFVRSLVGPLVRSFSFYFSHLVWGPIPTSKQASKQASKQSLQWLAKCRLKVGPKPAASTATESPHHPHLNQRANKRRNEKRMSCCRLQERRSSLRVLFSARSAFISDPKLDRSRWGNGRWLPFLSSVLELNNARSS